MSVKTKRYINAEPYINRSIIVTAIYSRTGVAENDQRKILLQSIQFNGKEILDHLWVDTDTEIKLAGNEKVIFKIKLVKRTRPGVGIFDEKMLDVKSKYPIKFKIVK